MEPFKRTTGAAVPLIEDDINTDQIAPIQGMRQLKPDYKKLLFMRARTRRRQREPRARSQPAAVPQSGDPGERT